MGVASRAPPILYSNGKKALSINGSDTPGTPGDGSGFGFYPSGRIALCASAVDKAHNCRYYLYEDNKLNSLMCAIDENAIGFAIDRSNGKHHGMKLVLGVKGGLISDETGYITKQWQWNSPPGKTLAPPTSSIVITLNSSFTFEFKSRTDITVHFQKGGVEREFRMGVRVMANYLSKSVRLSGGKVQPDLAGAPTLIERQAGYASDMKAKRDKLRPRSQNLEGEIKDIVLKLEHELDGHQPTVKPYQDPEWRAIALGKTQGELPKLNLTGCERGPTRGLGDSIYCHLSARHKNNNHNNNNNNNNNNSRSGVRSSGLAMTYPPASSASTPSLLPYGSALPSSSSLSSSSSVLASSASAPALSRLRDDKGQWLNELELRRTIMEDNPLLKRSGILQAASGRYAEEILVPGGKVSATNPSGKTLKRGLPVETVHANRFENFLQEQASRSDQLTVVACIRPDDKRCVKVERVLELANEQLHKGSVTQSGHDDDGAFKIVRVDTSESNALGRKYDVQSVPGLLMFYRGDMVWAGGLGGLPVKSSPLVALKALLIEPDIKQQVIAERAIRKLGCFLHDVALNGHDAHKLITQQLPYDVIFLSDKLTSNDVAMLSKSVRVGTANPPLMLGMATLQGDVAYLNLPAGLLQRGIVLKSELLQDNKSSSNNSNKQGGNNGTGSQQGGIQGTVENTLPSHIAHAVDGVLSKPVRVSSLRRVVESCKVRQRARLMREDTALGPFGHHDAGSAHGGGGGGGGGVVEGSHNMLEDQHYMGLTPTSLLAKMRAVRHDALLGRRTVVRSAPAGGYRGGSGKGAHGAVSLPITMVSQEVVFKGVPLQKSGVVAG